jgi:hypothetical protein
MNDVRTIDFIEQLEAEVRSVLNSSDVSTADRLRAVEIGSKLLMIRHRINGAGEGEDGKFFSKAG